MISRAWRIALAAAALLVAACDEPTAPTPVHSAPRPSLAMAVGAPVDLGALPAGQNSWATHVSELGRAVGYGDDGAQHDHALYFPSPGTVIDLGTFPGGANSQAWGISEVWSPCAFPCLPLPRPWVVGWSERLIVVPSFPSFQFKNVVRAFVWRPGLGMTDLGTLGGDNSWAQGVTATGTVVGMSETAGGVFHAFSWTPAGGMVDINPSSAFESQAWNANAAGYITGYAVFPTLGMRAVRWTPAGLVILNSAPGQNLSKGRDVNAFGVVAGMGEDPTPVDRALVWSATPTPKDIGTLPGFTHGNAWGINDLGWVVGASFGPVGSTAFVWTSAGGLVPLPTLGGAGGMGVAYDVNNAGTVVGASDAPGGMHATMWPVRQLGGTCAELCVASPTP